MKRPLLALLCVVWWAVSGSPICGQSGVPINGIPNQSLGSSTTGTGTTLVKDTAPLLSNPSIGTTSLTISVVNAASTGTTLNKLAKLTGAPSTAVIAATTDTSGIVGVVVSGAGIVGTAQIGVDGDVSCAFDGPTTANDFVQISPTVPGDCHDAGAVYPASGQVVGRVLSTNGSGGTYLIQYYQYDTRNAAGGSGLADPGGNGIIKRTALNTTAVAVIADLPTYTNTGTGAVARSIASRLGDWITVKDFGATGDGSTDDTTAIQAAINAAGDVGATEHGGQSVWFPAGVYIISACLTVPSGVWLDGVSPITSNPPTTYGTTIRTKASTSIPCMVRPSDIVDGNYQAMGIRNMHFDGNHSNGGAITAGGSILELQNIYDASSFANLFFNQYTGGPAIRIGPGSASIGYGPAQFDNIWINPNFDGDGIEINDYYTNAANNCGSNHITSCFAFVGVIHFHNIEVQDQGTGIGMHITSKTSTAVGQSGEVREIYVSGLDVASGGTGNASTCLQIDGAINSKFEHVFCGLNGASPAAVRITNTAGNVTSSGVVLDGVTTDGTVATTLIDSVNSVTLAGGTPINHYEMANAGAMISVFSTMYVSTQENIYNGIPISFAPAASETGYMYGNGNGPVFGINNGSRHDMGFFTPNGFYVQDTSGNNSRLSQSGADIFFQAETTNGSIQLQPLGTGTVIANKTVQAPRFKASQGTTLVSGDFANSGWGTSPSIGTITGTDQAFQATMTAGTGSPSANPTITLTFHDGTWANAPIMVCENVSGGTGTKQLWSTAPTATNVVLTYNGTPAASATLPFSCIAMGR